jgi:hypothetical protein
LLAMMVMGYEPAVFAAGVPLSTPAANVTPAGRVPDSLKVGAGNPDAITVNEPRLPTVNVVAAALVKVGTWPIVSLKLWVAFEPTLLLAVMVMGYEPTAFAAGVPLSTPAENVTPAGSVPDSLKVGAGNPDAVTGNEPRLPTVNVVAAPLVMAGPSWPVPFSVTFWLAAVALSAVSVNVATLWIAPVLWGVKLTLKLQLAPGVSEKLLVQSEGVPEPATCMKLAPTLKPGATAFSAWLPMFSTITDCELPGLLPTTAGAKLSVGGCARWTSTTRLLPVSAMKTSPAPSTATPFGLLSPLPTVV